MLGIGEELSIFMSACLTGVFLCMIYFAIRVFRRIVSHSLLWISVEDFVFWVGAGLYLFVEMYRTCGGNIRWYFVLGVLFGCVVSCRSAWKVKKVIDKKRKTR